MCAAAGRGRRNAERDQCDFSLDSGREFSGGSAPMTGERAMLVIGAEIRGRNGEVLSAGSCQRAHRDRAAPNKSTSRWRRTRFADIASLRCGRRTESVADDDEPRVWSLRMDDLQFHHEVVQMMRPAVVRLAEAQVM